jgi:hypothetical protein
VTSGASPRAGGSATRNPRNAACSNAAQTRIGVVGMSRCLTPRADSASTTALCTAGVEPMVAASPIPLTPNGFRVVGVAESMSSKSGSSVAVMNE